MNNRDYPNSGILFGNDRKSGDRDPDHKGNADITCAHCGRSASYWLSAWRKVGRAAGEFLSLSLRPKDDAQLRPAAASRAQDDDKPWR